MYPVIIVANHINTVLIVNFQNFTGYSFFLLSFPCLLFFILIYRPLTEEEIIDLRERHYDSIAEKQKDLDKKIQKEVSSRLCSLYCVIIKLVFYKGEL